jgi:cytochrome c556
MQRIPTWIPAGLLLACLGGGVVAADMAGVVHDRQAHFKQIGKAAKGIKEALGAPAPDVKAIQGYAKTIDQLAPQLPTWFPAGSGPQPGVKTEAKAVIWTKASDFKSAADGFASEAKRFDAVAAGGDAAAIRAGYGALGKACKTCHDQFREKDD